jgi:His-Xaa-Ser system protein HxsD
MEIDITFDLAVFSLDAVKAACYKFLDRFTADIELRGGKIICHLAIDDKLSDAAVSANLDDLKKEVLDQDLRLKLRAETEPLRNLILAHTFSKTGLIADE